MQIKLQLFNKINDGFLRMIMHAKISGPIKIDRNSPVGKYISSRVRYSNFPVKQSSGLILILPKTTNESANNYFLYFSVEDQKKINDFLEAEFYRFFHRVMLTGDELEKTKSKLINFVIQELNLLDDTKIFENLKKSDYRERLKIKNFILNSA